MIQFWNIIENVDFEPILTRFFPEKSGSVTFLRLLNPNFMQKIRKN